MNKYFSLVKKEFCHVFRDRFTIMVILMILTIQFLLFGLMLITEVRTTKIAVYDPSKDISTSRIIKNLDASKYRTLVEVLHNADDIQRVFREGTASLAVVFSENFHDNLLHTGECDVQLIADATQPVQALGYATGIIGDYRQELMRDVRMPFQIVPETRMLYNPQSKGSFNFVPGAMGVILFLICVLFTAISTGREKEHGTMELFPATPMKRVNFILAKVTPCFIIAAVDLCAILLFAVYVMHVPAAGNLFLLLTLVLLLMIGGLFTGVLLNSQNRGMQIYGFALIPLSVILSGMVFAVETMPAVYQWVSAVLPARWYIQAARKVMIQGVDIALVAKELIILAGMIAFIVFVSLKTFRTKLN
jgi:ABC-2 type transport system permease protein